MFKAKLILLTSFLAVLLLVPAISVHAECKLNGVDNGGDVGTFLPDKIVCNASNVPVGDVEGLFSDDIIRIRTTVPGDVDGGDGDDDIIVGKANGVVTGDLYGEIKEFDGSFGIYTIGPAGFYLGGNDIITVDGTTALNVEGEDVSVENMYDITAAVIGGADTIDITGLTDDVEGDDISSSFVSNSGITAIGGADSITIAGVADNINGDNVSHSTVANSTLITVGGADNISITGVAEPVRGDGISHVFVSNSTINTVGGADNITVTGEIRDVEGDAILFIVVTNSTVNTVGGDDRITIIGETQFIGGDFLGFSGDGNTIQNFIGGNDRIRIIGTVTEDVYGERMIISGSGNTIINSIGGDDVIVIEEGGSVGGSLFGDDDDGNLQAGGDDIFRVKAGAIVGGDVIGDNVTGQGGDDIIRIWGTVNGNVIGDEAGTPGNDIIRVYAGATVGGDVCGDNLVPCNNNGVIVFDENTNPNQDGEDTIIIAGKVLGDVIAGANFGAQADDTVVIVEGAEVAGTIYAGDEDSGDTLVYVENIVNEEKTISEVLNIVNDQEITDGTITINGETYSLDNVETVTGAVGQIACFGMDYRMNKSSDGCSARSQSEKDAIQWHRNNPGADGRLPGLEGCAVYSYGHAMRIYQIVDGSDGELVAELWGDVFSNGPTTNELLGQTADGNVKLYHLASGELQLECRNLVDGKVQVRVLSDLAGTVVDAFDKG